MTVDAISPIQSHPVAGTGPYGTTWPYAAGGVRASILAADGRVIDLHPGDYTVSPLSSDTAGSVFLSAPVAAAYAGATLQLARATPAEQGWAGTRSAREHGLERQLDQMSMVDQELRSGLARSLRSTEPLPPFTPGPEGTLLIRTATGYGPGPDAGHIAAAEGNAVIAAAAANSATISADRAEIAAAAFDRAHEIDLTERALYSSQNYWASFFNALASGSLLPTYPGVLPPTPIVRPPETPEYLANVEIVLKRLRQMASIQWSPLIDVPGERGPDYHQQGETYTGPPYSSVKTLGRPIGWGVTFETFLSAVRNLDSILYEDFTALPNWHSGSGHLYYGAVCSNFIARGFGWFYSPVTEMLDRDWRHFGFVGRVQLGSFTSADMKRGDVVNSVGGGHIEIVLDRTETTITLFDQGYDGPQTTTYSTVAVGGGLDAATEYVRRRGYALLIYDYEASTVAYEANSYAPLPGEVLPPAVFNDVVMINRGNRANYTPGETVRFNVVDAAAADLVIKHEGVTIETVPLAAPEIVSRSFSDIGTYTAHCVMADTSESLAETFKVARIDASLSISTVARGDDVTVGFTARGCTPRGLIVQHAVTMSIGPGIIREIRPSDWIDDDDGAMVGSITFSADLAPRDYHVRIFGLTEFGEVYTEPMNLLTLTVEA